MRFEIKLEIKYIDGKPVLYTPAGEPTTIADALKAIPLEKEECLPVMMTICDEDEERDEAKIRAAHTNFIKKLKEKYPDGHLRTEDGRRIKIRGLNREQ